MGTRGEDSRGMFRERISWCSYHDHLFGLVLVLLQQWEFERPTGGAWLDGWLHVACLWELVELVAPTKHPTHNG